MNWQIGCSGFYYKEWKDFFYPKGLAQKDWFKFYCEHFNTIEINSSFYRMPSAKSLDKWFHESSADFSFTMKAPRLITHYKQLKDCENDFLEFYQVINEGLREKLACVLFQFPPSFSFTEERLQRLIELLTVAPSQNVVEFRHSSWWSESIYTKLAHHQITFAGQSYPSNLPEDIIENCSTIYYRFHGKPVLYKSEYNISVLEDFVKRIPSATKQAFVYFNNTWGHGAITNAKQLITLLS
ncbi:hypothetical protein D3C87_695360 [compost metagenome]